VQRHCRNDCPGWMYSTGRIESSDPRPDDSSRSVLKSWWSKIGKYRERTKNTLATFGAKKKNTQLNFLSRRNPQRRTVPVELVFS
jgi:hypothetical protein